MANRTTATDAQRQGGGVLGAFAATSDAWAAYRAVRLQTAALPPDDAEQALTRQAAAGLRRYLDLDPEQAERQARRYVLYRREARLHETLMLDLAPAALDRLLDGLQVVGLERVQEPARQGLLLSAYHYGPHSSLLCLWLARAAARGLLPRLAVALDSGGGLGRFPEQRLAELEAGGLVRRQALELLDLYACARPAAELAARLRQGAALLIEPDTSLLPPDDWTAVPVRAGRRALGFPRGSLWLALLVGRPLAAASIRPVGDTHLIELGPMLLPSASQPAEVAAALRETLQGLWDRTVGLDPAPWEWWPSLCGDAMPRSDT